MQYNCTEHEGWTKWERKVTNKLDDSLWIGLSLILVQLYYTSRWVYIYIYRSTIRPDTKYDICSKSKFFVWYLAKDILHTRLDILQDIQFNPYHYRTGEVILFWNNIKCFAMTIICNDIDVFKRQHAQTIYWGAASIKWRNLFLYLPQKVFREPEIRPNSCTPPTTLDTGWFKSVGMFCRILSYIWWHTNFSRLVNISQNSFSTLYTGWSKTISIFCWRECSRAHREVVILIFY